MNNNSELIDRYLQNEMDAAERTLFENRLAADTVLQQEFSIQQQIIKAAETAGLKNEFGKGLRKKTFQQRLWRWGIVGTILVGAFIFYAVKSHLFSAKPAKQEHSPIEYFQINNSADTIIETKDDVVFGIPANAFGNSAGSVKLEIRTALTPDDIIKQGLSTTSNGMPLQTAGMFYINAYENDQQLSLVKNIDVSVPADDINPAMQLFDGVQDTNGHINWVNPKPVEKKLRTYDIITLDFYPPDYIPTLKALQKDYRDKKYTDSLYYSFSGFPYGPAEKDSAVGDIVMSDINTSAPIVNIDEGKDYTKADTSKYPMADSSGKFLKDTIAYGEEGYHHYELDPARIRTIWNKEFNNTILATKEFEERLRYIHTLCDAKYLDAYVEGLTMPMYKIDQVCADNSRGEIRKKFLEFAARKDGRVMINEGMQEKLSDYFQKKYNAYRQASIKTWEKYKVELQRLNDIADEKKREQSYKDFRREDKNFEEEFCANLTDAYRQIGVSRSCNDTVVPPAVYYNITISTTGWKNLDVYVFDATTTRQSMSYTDPVTSKTATLTFKDVTINVNQQSQYDRVLVYLIPDSLSSFQRVEQQGGGFKESLNSLFRYNAVAIGYKGEQMFFAQERSLSEAVYSLELTAITEKQFREALQQYSKRISKELKEETDYRLFEQQEELRQIQLENERVFREQVAAAIFKCGGAK